MGTIPYEPFGLEVRGLKNLKWANVRPRVKTEILGSLKRRDLMVVRLKLRCPILSGTQPLKGKRQ